ncbi:MAG: hypothetical protein ABIQ89_01410 [Candidatus Saccharimonadales bacterium]
MFGHDDEDDKKDDAAVVAPTTDTTTDDSVAATSSDSDITDVTETTSTPADVTETPQPLAANEPSPNTSDEPASSDSAADSGLLDLKKQALEELSPLVGHLDQTPLEKFRTIMMLIQATDSSNLIKSAHDAAKEITDEKERAQALLDIVNEINYFTQK